MIRRINPTESEIQCGIVEWADNTFVDHPLGGKVRLGPYLIKITNEGKQKVFQDKNGNYFCPTGMRYNKEGRKKGASDLFLAFPVLHVNEYGDTEEDLGGFWFEVKKKGKKLTDEQCEFLCAMKDIGYGVGWADNVDDGIQAFKNYLRIL